MSKICWRYIWMNAIPTLYLIQVPKPNKTQVINHRVFSSVPSGAPAIRHYNLVESTTQAGLTKVMICFLTVRNWVHVVGRNNKIKITMHYISCATDTRPWYQYGYSSSISIDLSLVFVWNFRALKYPQISVIHKKMMTRICVLMLVWHDSIPQFDCPYSFTTIHNL